jgi:hypothetical protein
MIELALFSFAVLLLALSTAVDRQFLLSPLFHYGIFFLLFIVPVSASATSEFFPLLVFIGAIAFAIGYLCTRSTQLDSARPPFVEAPPAGERSLAFVAAIYVIGSVAQFAGQLTISGTSLESFFACPICETSLIGKKNVAVSSVFFLVMSSLLDIQAFRRLQARPNYYAAVIVGVLRVLFYVSALGTGRVMILLNLLLPILFVALLKGDLRNRLTQVSAVGLGAILLLPALFALNQLRHGQIEETITLVDSVTSFKSDLNPGANLDQLIRFVDQNGFDYGFFLVSPVLTVVPRDIFPEKPITSLQFYYTQEIFRIDPLFDITTYTFTMFDSYSAFGVASLAIVSLLYGVFFAGIYGLLRSNRLSTKLFAAEFCFLSMNVFRTNLFDGLIFIIVRYIALRAFDRRATAHFRP